MATNKKKSTILFDPKAKTENIKRPNHPDFMTSSELKGVEFTGVRPNPVGNLWEFWILGEVVKTVTFQAVAINKMALTEAHIEVFHMAPAGKVFKRG